MSAFPALCRIILSMGLLAVAATGAEAAPATIDAGDTAWVLISAALVLFMTIPGLALFYGGLVRAKNVLTLFVQCFALTAIISLLWWAFGYSLAFSQPADIDPAHPGIHAFIGDGARCFFAGMRPEALWPGTRIPEAAFCLFQLTFAIITPALLIGAFAERLKFGAILTICVGWFVFAYLPICHMAWGGAGSFLGSGWGLADFAGGTVVEVASGMAGLTCAIAAGRRFGYLQQPIVPHNLVLCLSGAAMLWIGWFGFNAGSALAANGTAAMAALNTQLAAAAAVVTWMAVEWLRHGRPSALGIATAGVAGLVGITPGCGFVSPLGAVAVGVAAALASFVAVMILKQRFRYDDSLDVFGVHGVAGLVGLLLTGVFGVQALGGTIDRPLGDQLAAQAFSALVTMLWSGGVAFALMKLVNLATGLRAPQEDELSGLDVAQHGEAAYNHD